MPDNKRLDNKIIVKGIKLNFLRCLDIICPPKVLEIIVSYAKSEIKKCNKMIYFIEQI